MSGKIGKQFGVVERGSFFIDAWSVDCTLFSQIF